ncbi:Crp/Fnr family transcriptional regulator [Mitsuokella multacida]|nr:Crp/Fnr family transcriptional regulator [Mitsuokella multacida]
MGIYDLDLQELPLFEGLKADEVEQFIQATGAKVKRYGKEVRILKAYETNSRIGIIVEGEALVLAEDRFGNETIGHRLEQRGALFGSTTAILPGYASPTAIEAVSDVLVLWVPYTALLVAGPRLGRIHGIVMRNLLVAFCRKNVLMMQKLEVLSQKTLRERLILYLLQQAGRQKTDCVKVPGRVQLAKELECNRSALTREIGLMKEKGLLECGPDWMRLDEARLREER